MKYLKILYVQVIIGILAGILVGYLFPGFAATAKLISDIFINMIRMMVLPIVFFTIVLGIAGAGSLKKAGRAGMKGLIYFEIMTTLALVIGVVVANLIRPGTGLSPERLQADEISKYATTVKGINWVDFFSHIFPANIFDAAAKGDVVGILFFGILFAIGLSQLGEAGQGIIRGFEKINQVLFNVLKIIIKLSPLGAFGGMAFMIGKYGFTSLALLGKLVITFYMTSLLFIFIVLNLVLRYYGFSLWKLLVYIKKEILIVFGASSSESVLANIMQKLEQAGCEKKVVRLVIPTGYSFNLDGTTIYLSLCVIFLAQLFHVPLSIWQQLSIIIVLIVTSKGAAGVTGSGLLVLSSSLAATKILPGESVALLVGIDRFMSEARAITNMIGNTVATVVIAKSENAIDLETYKEVVEKNQG